MRTDAKNIATIFASGLLALTLIGAAPRKDAAKKDHMTNALEGCLSHQDAWSEKCDDQYVLKRKKAPDACRALPPDKEECGRWYSAEATRILVLKDVHFAFGRSEIPETGKPLLRKYAIMMKENPKTRIRIDGHTDSIGSEEYNQVLSQKRAQAIKEFLAAQGVGPDRMMIEAQGESRPLVSNRTDEGRQENRRVEIKFLGSPARTFSENVKVLHGR